MGQGPFDSASKLKTPEVKKCNYILAVTTCAEPWNHFLQLDILESNAHSGYWQFQYSLNKSNPVYYMICTISVVVCLVPGQSTDSVEL